MVFTALLRGLKKAFPLNTLKPKSFLHTSYRFKFTVRMPETQEAFLRIESEENKFQLSFAYVDDETGTHKELHFHRNLQDVVQPMCNRIALKLNTGGKKKGKARIADEKPAILVQILKNGVPVSNTITCQELFGEDNSDLTLRIGNKDFCFVTNAPWVQNIVLPDSIMCGFIIYPHKLKGMFIKENESEFLWYRCKEGLADELMGTGWFYIPTAADIGYKLKLQFTPSNNGVKGPTVETCSTCEIEAGPGHCPFEDRHVFTKNTLTGNSFRVVSYNILADLYASSTTGREELFTYCPPYALALNYRKQLLFKELIGYNADIICLQEVDVKSFERDLQKVLKTKNMDGIMAKKAGQVNEGVACFYNQSRFKLLSSFSRFLGEDISNEEFSRNIWNRINANNDFCLKMKERTNVFQVLVLSFVDNPKHKLIVGNTHLYFHPDADHVRLLQAGMCLNIIEDVKNQFQSKDSESTFSILFCGDFNSTPECGVYQLFTTGEVPAEHNEWICGNESVTELTLRTPFKFKSACGTPPFTHYTPHFKGCLDYIYYQRDNLDVEQVIPFPSEEEVSRFIAIPNVVFPSDHLALVADLAWK